MAEQQSPTYNSQTEQSQNATPIAVPVETVPLTSVLASIVRDSKKSAANYLSQVHVPHGGE
ncbi:hypothetical protein [Thalassoroseus pseudoceratinae]|uniref:hypothetical protein n=1 Tax=Thalassoroseus pseudoceratinae TaxID=2713176 RepID=UPI001423C64D|nr:hypothetical protein [Thalassoroseus pseudoceratinae]